MGTTLCKDGRSVSMRNVLSNRLRSRQEVPRAARLVICTVSPQNHARNTRCGLTGRHVVPSFFLAPATMKRHSSDQATRVQIRVHEVGHGHVSGRVPRVAEPGVHEGLGGQPVLVETTRAARLLTVQRHEEGVASESDTDVGDLPHPQGRRRTTSTRTSVLSLHKREKLAAARTEVPLRDRTIVRISEVNGAAASRTRGRRAVRCDVNTDFKGFRGLD